MNPILYMILNTILNTNETLLGGKKVRLWKTCEKNNCLSHLISFAVICVSLLVIVSVSCYPYYIKHWSKQKDLLPYIDTSNKLKVNSITWNE